MNTDDSKRPPPIDPRARGISALEQELWAVAARANTLRWFKPTDRSNATGYERLLHNDPDMPEPWD